MIGNQIALQALLNPKNHKVQARLKAAVKKLWQDPPCPECGCTGPHQDNGRTFCCNICGEHFDHEVE